MHGGIKHATGDRAFPNLFMLFHNNYGLRDTIVACMAETTTIEIKNPTWTALSARKSPGDSFDDVIQRLLEENNE
jgi:hypothetical protein